MQERTGKREPAAPAGTQTIRENELTLLSIRALSQPPVTQSKRERRLRDRDYVTSYLTNFSSETALSEIGPVKSASRQFDGKLAFLRSALPEEPQVPLENLRQLGALVGHYRKRGRRMLSSSYLGMRALLGRFRLNLPTILAVCLLGFQIVIPWTVSEFVTADGPSHLYTAEVAKNLLFHPHSSDASFYRWNPRLVPNWTGTILFGVATSLFGPPRAEKVVASLSILTGFFAFAYAIRSFAPRLSPWTPLSNFLLQTWFLGVGFYNFYLGMALCPFLIGYYVRAPLTVHRSAVIAAGLAGLFLTHLVAAGFAAMVLVVLALWLYLAMERDFQQIGLVIAAVIPTAFLCIVFARSAEHPIHFSPTLADAISSFPMQVFATADGPSGTQPYLVPVALALIVISILAMRASEWRGPRGGLTAALFATVVVYLTIPESGLGGALVKVRFSWAFFILGVLLACSIRRLHPLRTPIAIYVAALLMLNLIASERAVLRYSVAVQDYLSAMSGIRPGATFVRLRYPTPDLPRLYGFSEIWRDPLFHLDAYAAVRCRCIDLSDYEAPNGVFPVVFGSTIDTNERYSLWSLEGPGNQTSETLEWLRSKLPIDYVVIVADESSPLREDREKLEAALTRDMRVTQDARFIHVYQRR
jgi:hypothetical protein